MDAVSFERRICVGIGIYRPHKQNPVTGTLEALESIMEGWQTMTNKEKLIGKSSLDMASWIIHTFSYCEYCLAHGVCAIKHTDKGCYKPNCTKEIAKWLEMEADDNES